MPTTASTITRSPVDAINGLSPGDRRVLNENELAQRRAEPQDPAALAQRRAGPALPEAVQARQLPLESVIEFERGALHDSTSERAAR
jgi:hypothetical protein